MDFFVFLEEAIISCHQMSVGPNMFDVSFREIVNRFWEKMATESDSFVPPTTYRLFYDDISNPFESFAPVEIEDLSKPLSSLPIRSFDLIITLRFTPMSTHSLSLLDGRRTEDSEFDRGMVRARTCMKNREFCAAFGYFSSAAPYGDEEVEELNVGKLQLFMKMKNYRLALENVQDLLKKQPGNSRYQFMLAKISQRMGLHEEAIEQFKRYLILARNEYSRYDLVNLYIAKSLYAMEHFDHAETLVLQIVNNDEMNVKARVLLAKILAKQGRLSEALRLVIQNFSIEPDNKSSRKFIGQHVINDKQVEVLKSELGDGVKNANTMFYVGHMLREFGSCRAATSFMRQAMELAPNDPSICVGALQNFLCTGPSPSEFFELAKVVLETVSNAGEDFRDLSKIDFSEFVTDFERPQPKMESIEIPEIFKSGPNVCEYNIPKFDAFWAASLIYQFLFSKGYIIAAEPINAILRKILATYDFVGSIITQEVYSYDLISAMSSLIPRPLVERKPIFMIGDETCLVFAYRVIKYQGEEYNLIPVHIVNGHASEIVSKKGNRHQTAYSIEFERIPDGSSAILTFSRIQSYDRFSGLQEHSARESMFLQAVADEHATAVAKIAKHWVANKHGRVWGFPVISMENEPMRWAPTLRQMNRRLAFRMWSLNQSNPSIGMIDIFDECVISEKESIVPTFVVDTLRFRPEVLPLIERAINSTESRLQEYLSTEAPV